ncbi:MAG: 50S ribosomal protein L29 [Opitutales bacterium]
MALNVKDLRENSVAELEKTLRESREELLKTRLSKRTGQLEKPHLLKELRRDIARLETTLTAKKREAAAN